MCNRLYFSGENMKSFLFLLVILGSVASIQAQENLNKSSVNSLNGDDWVWGYVVVPETTTTIPIEKTTPYNPCLDKTYSPKPDFTVLGRRISEIKCYEYIWEVKHRDEKANRARECNKYRFQHRGPLDPHFAIGGRDTEPGEFPHMGAIGWKAVVGTWVFRCGSSLISPKFVLTAAHCSRISSRDTSIEDPEPKIVRLGDKNILDDYTSDFPPKDERIIRIIVHPKFSPPKKYNDIALMELENPVEFSKFVQPACLWDQEDTTRLGKEATVTGWGVVQARSQDISLELQAAVVDILSTETCDTYLKPHCSRNWCGMEDQICAGKLAGGVDACQGDSGGPLQVKIPLPVDSEGAMHYVIGVTSFGIDCALPNLPGVYTRVSSFIDWIENNVWR